MGTGHAAEGDKLTGSAVWEADMIRFEALDKAHPPAPDSILFIGSSSIRLWKTLAGDFPDQSVINRGFGGSQLVDSLYFADRIATPYRPRMIVMYAGANDISSGKSALQVFGDYRAFVAKIHTALPACRIAFIAIAGNPARWSQVDRIREANRLIQSHCQSDPRLIFIDTFSAMLGQDGLPKPDIFVNDQLHMNEKGYAIWRALIGPHLTSPPKP
jgi:lysophospholipase L1-like esterase